MSFLAAGDAMDHVMDHALLERGGHHFLTQHMITLVVAIALLLWLMNMVAKAIATGPESEGNERYLTKGKVANLVEVMVVFLRDQMIEPVLGPKTTAKYLPFLMTMFFFILMLNLVGLIPFADALGLIGVHGIFGGTATANLSVTAALAVIAAVVIQMHGFRELGFKGWAHHLLGGAPWWLFPLMVPVELAGHIIKPAALAIRLFANMFGGHVLLGTLLLFGYGAATAGKSFIGITGISIASGIFALCISFLELFVAVLQAFIFMFLTAVFISLMSHHDDEHEEHHETSEPEAVPAHA